MAVISILNNCLQTFIQKLGHMLSNLKTYQTTYLLFNQKKIHLNVHTVVSLPALPVESEPLRPTARMIHAERGRINEKSLLIACCQENPRKGEVQSSVPCFGDAKFAMKDSLDKIHEQCSMKSGCHSISQIPLCGKQYFPSPAWHPS